MVRSQFARWVGVIAAAVGSISAIWWIPYYPVWSLVYIFMGILVIYGLVAHGEREPSVVDWQNLDVSWATEPTGPRWSGRHRAGAHSNADQANWCPV